MYERIENASIRLFCKYIFSAALPDLFMTGMVAVDFRGWAGGGAALAPPGGPESLGAARRADDFRDFRGFRAHHGTLTPNFHGGGHRRSRALTAARLPAPLPFQ